MMAKWTIYTGSDEQIAEMGNAKHKYVIRTKSGKEYIESINNRLIKDNYQDYVTHYLICNPHPLADMICQQARTGQPVWWRSIEGGATGLCYKFMPPFAHPDTFEYSFTEFKGEV